LEPIEPTSDRRYPPICILNDDALLNIFYLYQLDIKDEYDDSDGSQAGQWKCYRWWYKLAQVSQWWRYLILASTSRLDLYLVCTYGVPVADMLAYSPLLPLAVFYMDDNREMTIEDEEGALLALSHRDRVRRVALKTPAPKLGKFITAMDDQFPTLERLYMHSPRKEDTSLILPQTFQAPNLRHLSLWYTGIPIRSPSLLLTTTGGLVSLRLGGIPRSAYFPPGYILTRLSLMPQLETLGIAFHSPVPNQDVIRQLSEIPTTMHVTLPNLGWFGFKGVSAYLEGLLERISAPVLGSLQIHFFNQLAFTVPRLSQFMQTSENIIFQAVELAFKKHFVELIVNSHEERLKRPFLLRILGRHLDWQIASAVQILGTVSPILSIVENLTLSYEEHDVSSEWHNEVDRTQWRELLRPFSNVKVLRVPTGLVSVFSRSLCAEDGEESLELLPNLLELQYSGRRRARDASAFTPFINERRTTGHPVRLKWGF
jgi:hypothetical protein